MQFNLRSLIQAFAVLSIYFGFAFAIPPLISGPILILVTLLLPSAIVCGIVYGSGPVRAFWIGAAAGGFFPLLFTFYFGLLAGAALVSDGFASALFGGAGMYFVRTFVVVHTIVFGSGAFAVVFHKSIIRKSKTNAEPAETQSA